MEQLHPKTSVQQNRPLITYDGDIAVFQSIAPYLQKGIGTETVEWKRAHLRSTKHVHLHPRFVPFNNPDINASANASSSIVPSSIPSAGGTVPEEVALAAKEGPPLTSLLDQQMLHTYWTDCADVEVYKTTTKDAIQSWLNNVKECNVKDWFIILVETPDNKKTKQLLPRSSVLDKIKSDFAQKQTERCICLNDPNKLDSKSAESLHAMLHRLRQLLLNSYNKTLTKFEENMRARREKSNGPGWNFCHYFLLQEELALVLEMLEVYDEALVQYDELDALFTQFVLNSHLIDTPQWLLSFQRYGDHWPALTLSSSDSTQILNHIRETIRNSTVSLLNFRNYLFTRQATLLVQQKRINELAQRSLGFLHNCINELSILDVTFSEEGAMSAWVFVSCLEVLEVICDHGQGPPLVNGNVLNNNDAAKSGKSVKGGAAQAPSSATQQQQNLMLASDFSVHTASIWDYAREKLYELGKMNELLPKSKPRSDHLHKVVSLAAGLTALDNNIISASDSNNTAPTINGGSKEHTLPTEGSTTTTYISTIPQHDSSRETPIDKLKNSLSSKEQFERHYLELCELGMGTYKHIGRLRSARKVGLSLAEFYMEAGEYQKAIGFLTDAQKTYESDKWSHLVMAVLLHLAQCYHEINDNDRYIRTCKQLACSTTMDIERRTYYFNEVMKSLQMYKNESPLRSSFEDTFSIVSINIETPGKIDLDSCEVTIVLELISKFPKPLENCKIASALLVCDHEHLNKKQQHGPQSGSLSSASFSSQSGAPLTSKGSTRKSHNQAHAHGDTTKSRHTENTSEIATICEEEDANLTLSEIGDVNNMKLSLEQQFDMKQDKSYQGGRLYCQNSHIALRRKDSQMQEDVQVEKTDFKIAAISDDIIINPGCNLAKLYAKISEPGAYRLGQLSVRVKQLELLSRRMGCRYNFKIERVPGSIELASADANLNLIAGIEQVITLVLTTGSNRIESGTALKIRASVGLQLKLSENSPLCSELSVLLPPIKSFSSTTVQLRVKAELGPQKDNNLIEHKLMICCPWTNDETKLRIVFAPPFRSSYKLNTVGSRKFLQVTLHGLSSSNFVISNHQLSIQGHLSQDIPIVPLNPRSQELILSNRLSASYMWEIGVEHYDDESQIRLEFSTTFSSQEQMQQQNPELYKYYICLQRFKTQYEVTSRVEAHKGAEFCRVGNMCSMIIDIQRVEKKGDVENSLMYEVRADQYIWAICGKTAGVISMEGTDQQQIKLDVMPMSHGFLPLPTVHLSKYVLGDPKGGGPKLEAFNPGQIFTKCKGAQLHILPPPQPPSSNPSVVTGGIGVAPPMIPMSEAHY